MLKFVVTLTSAVLLAATATAYQDPTESLSRNGRPPEQASERTRQAQFTPPAGESSSPKIERPDRTPPRPKRKGPMSMTAGDWMITAGAARRRKLAGHATHIKLGPRLVKLSGELSMHIGGTYGKTAGIADITAEFFVTGDTPIVGKEMRLLLDDREIIRVVLPAYRWVGDTKSFDPSKAEVRYRARLNPADLQKAKRVKASVLIDGREHVFYEDPLDRTDWAIRHLIYLGDPPHNQRSRSAKMPRCTPATTFVVPCCAGCPE
jgi:hypothetical protein